MLYWLFMLAMDLLVPACMIGFGKRFLKSAPQKINQDTWTFAHSFCGQLWVQCGKVLLAASVIAMLFFLGKDIGTVSAAGTAVCIVQTVVMVGTLFPVELALKKTFDKDGNRIQPS